MNDKPHGRLTADVADILSKHFESESFDVLSDHSLKRENVGKIVSWFGETYGRDAELSQLDIAIVEKNSSKAAALIEIEETNDRPKTFLGDVFGVLLGGHICFEGKRELLVGEWTTLIVIGKSEACHKERNRYLQNKAMKIKSALLTGNSKIGAIVIDAFSNAEELVTKLELVLSKTFKEKG